MARIAIGLLVALSACHDTPAPVRAAPASPATRAPSRAAAAYYHAELRAGDARCVHGQPCRAVVELVADGEYHVNPEYPFRFVAEATPGVSFAAERELRRDGDKRATLEVEFTPAAAGPTAIAGVFRLSVCSEASCQIERPRLGITVDVE